MTIKVVDYLRLVETIADTMARNGIRPEDVRNIPLVEDYERLRAEGHKYEYILRYLCEQYDVKRTSLYQIVKRMQKDMET